jgi:hypothetical protein
MEINLGLEARAVLASIAFGALVMLASIGSAPTPVLRNSQPEMISPGVHDAEDLVLAREQLSRTVVTVKSKISCQSETRCIMGLPAPIVEMVGVRLSALGTNDQKHFLQAIANRNCFITITGFFDGVQVDARKVDFETAGNCTN